jgi:peptide/nickel transport system substrate-binding protein
MKAGFAARLAALALGLLMLGACGKRGRHDYSKIADKDTVVNGGTRVESISAEASKLNPILVSDVPTLGVCGLIFNGLVRLNPKLEFEGDLAQSWAYTDGGKTLTFKLRKGVTWQDGQDFTSRDVAFTYNTIQAKNTASPAKGDFNLVEKVETPDPWTFVVHYKRAFAPALESWGMGVIPEHLLSKTTDINSDPFNRNPVGTGPYKFSKWVDKQFIELVANDGYYEGRPHIDRWIMRFIPDPSTNLLELKNGGVDGMTLQPDQFARETDGPDFTRMARKIRLDGRSLYTYAGFNLRRPPFNDKRVRLALSHAIDRDELIKGVLQGLARPCSGPYSPLSPAYNHEVKPVSFDLKESARLLDEAGWKLGKDGIRSKDGKPLKFRLITNQGNDSRKKIVLILQQQFAKLGVTAEVQMYEWSLYLKNYIDTLDFDMCVMAWNTGIDPDQFLIWHSSQTAPKQFNMVGYKNPVVDRLLEQGRTTMDQAARVKIYQRMHAIIAEDQPYAFLYSPDDLSAISLKFQGLSDTPTGYDWYWPNRWYIPASLQQ